MRLATIQMNSYLRVILLLLCCTPISARTGGGGVGPDATVVPSPSPSSAPSSFEVVPTPPVDTKCRTTNGVYGNQLDGEPQVVSYSYAVELKEGTSQSEFTSLLLPDLEVSMTDSLVPKLFPNCDTQARTRQRRLATSIIGISTRPIDTIEDDIECPVDATSCYGVFGTLTIFLDEVEGRRRTLQEASSSHITMVRDILKSNMDAGLYNNVSESILNVTWVDDGGDDNGITEPVPPTDDETNNNSNDRSTNGNGVIAWTVGMSAAAVLLLLVAVVGARRRRTNEDTDGESGIEAVSTVTPGLNESITN